MADDPTKKADDDDKKKKEVTTTELLEMVNKQNGLIQALKDDNTQAIQEIITQVNEKYGQQSDEMKNITNLLGRLAKGDPDEDLDDYTDDPKKTEDKFQNMINTSIQADKKVDADARKELGKRQADDYTKTIQRALNTRRDPEGKPLDDKARKDIMKLLTGDDKYFRDVVSNDGVEAAMTNFEKAYDRIYNLDKDNPFKGNQDVSGLGVGGGGGGGGTQEKEETVKLTKGTEDFLANTKNLEITREDAKRLIVRRNKRLAETE